MNCIEIQENQKGVGLAYCLEEQECDVVEYERLTLSAYWREWRTAIRSADEPFPHISRNTL